MGDRIVVRADLPEEAEEVTAVVGRARLLELIEGAHSLVVRRDAPGINLYVDGVPVVFEDGSDGSWVSAAIASRALATGPAW
jgi:hypothetical protein